ncbi:MAG TPA: hypothetical protein VGR21_05575 [Cryptosporangiaceae bacterium]|nr:hypothetical protein [Cryptosporangiaceae bacterium]
MTFAVSARGRSALMLALLVAVAVLVAGSPLPAPAAPGTGNSDPEGDIPTLRKAFESAASGYNNAKARLATSQKREAALNAGIKTLQTRVAVLSAQVQKFAVEAYSGGRPDPLTATLDGATMSVVLAKLSVLDQLDHKRGKQLEALHTARKQLDEKKAKVQREIKIQQVQTKTLAKKKADAEKALIAVGGFVSKGYVAGGTQPARASSRAADGSWPRESCSRDDPTTGGCLTPRTLHALQQAQNAGFGRYVSCYRSAYSGEHGKGRACDFAASATGFSGAATGGDRRYGNQLAGWLVQNADRLAVLYVIWYRQIWMPGTGWRTYYGGGDPSSAHTNHVHLSVQ